MYLQTFMSAVNLSESIRIAKYLFSMLIVTIITEYSKVFVFQNEYSF